MKDILKNLNYIAIIVLAIFYFFLGFLWYSPLLFEKLWMATLDKSIEELKAEPLSMAFSFSLMGIFSFLIIFILAVILKACKTEMIHVSIVYALLLSIGFILIPSFASHLFERANFIHYFINYMYPVTGVVISAIILTVWRKKVK